MLWEIAAGASTALALAGVADGGDDQQSSIVITGERLDDAAAEVAARPGGADLVPAEEYEKRSRSRCATRWPFRRASMRSRGSARRSACRSADPGISRGFHMRGLTLLQDGIPINLADDNGDFQELDPTDP